MKAYMRVEGGGALYPGVDCFQYPLEGHSETSNGQALLNPFDHYIKMKGYMRVQGGDTLPRGRLSPPPLLTMFIGTRYEKLFPASS